MRHSRAELPGKMIKLLCQLPQVPHVASNSFEAPDLVLASKPNKRLKALSRHQVGEEATSPYLRSDVGEKRRRAGDRADVGDDGGKHRDGRLRPDVNVDTEEICHEESPLSSASKLDPPTLHGRNCVTDMRMHALDVGGICEAHRMTPPHTESTHRRRAIVALVLALTLAIGACAKLTSNAAPVGPPVLKMAPFTFNYHGYPYQVTASLSSFGADAQLGDPGVARLKITGTASIHTLVTDPERKTAPTPGTFRLAFYSRLDKIPAGGALPTDPRSKDFSADCRAAIAGQPVCHLGTFTFASLGTDLTIGHDELVTYRSGTSAGIFDVSAQDAALSSYQEPFVKQLASTITNHGYHFIDYVAVLIETHIQDFQNPPRSCMEPGAATLDSPVAVFAASGQLLPPSSYTAFGVCSIGAG